MALLGIDFGTANVRVAVAPDRGEPTPSSITTSPAIVSFNGSRVNAGETVLMMAGAVPDVVVPGLKRLLGRAPGDEIVKRLAKRNGFRAATGELGMVLHAAPDDPSVSGKMGVIAGMTAPLRSAVEQACGGERHEAVITVPGWFDKPQREALLRAARLAKVSVLRFVNDVVASSLWAAHAHRIHGRVLVIDVGAGGVSGGIIDLDSTRVSLVRAAGSVACGGDDVDAQLATTAVGDADRKTFELVRQACEALKRSLDASSVATKTVQVDGRSIDLSIEGWELDLMLGGVSQAITDTCKPLLAGSAPGEIDRVLCMGGMSNLTGVRREIMSVTNAKHEDTVPAVDAPALGALRLAMAISGRRAMRHEVSDGEAHITHVSSAPPKASRGPSTGAPAHSAPPRAGGRMLSSAPVVRKKEVLRQRPTVTRKRLDPDVLRSRRSQAPTEDDADGDASLGPDESTAPEPGAPPRDNSVPQVSDSPPAGARARHRQPKATTGRPAKRSTDGAMPRVRSRKSSIPNAASAPPQVSAPPGPSAAPHANSPPGRSTPARSATRPRTTETDRTTRAQAMPPPSDVEDAVTTRRQPAPARESSPATEPQLSSGSPRNADLPPPPTSGATKYPARDGMRRYPMRDRGLKAPAVPDTSLPRRQVTTKPSERPPAPPNSTPPNSTPPGDPLAPASDPNDPGGAARAGESRVPGASPSRSSASGHTAAPYTQPPPGSRPTLAPSQLPREGTLFGLNSASEILAQPITGPIGPEDLNPVSLPVLLRRVLARRSVFGTFEVRAPGFEVRIDCDGGTAALSKVEYSRLMSAFDLAEADWRLLATREEEPLREPFPIARLAVNGLRKLLREQPTEACREALAARLQQAPTIRADRHRIPKRLGLSSRELRFIESQMDGSLNVEQLGERGSLGASTCFQLLILLDVYDAIAWGSVEAPDTAPLHDKLGERARRIASSNFFDVLLVHWGADDAEFAARYESRKTEFGPQSAHAKINPEACQRILDRVELAWSTLKDPKSRLTYRDETFPGKDFGSARDAAKRTRDMRARAKGAMNSKPPPSED